MKPFGDFPKLKIAGEGVLARQRHIAAPSEDRQLLRERKGHNTLPSWTFSFSPSLALCIDSRNGNAPKSTAELSDKMRERLAEKASHAPELVVIQPLNTEWTCHRC